MLRGWKYRKNMTVEWGDGSLWNCHEFESALDHDAMYAALKEIWERYKPQSDRRAMYFGGNGVHGCMAVVPIAAGLEAVAVMREISTRRLRCLPSECECA